MVMWRISILDDPIEPEQDQEMSDEELIIFLYRKIWKTTS
jgi:hypothetical protein